MKHYRFIARASVKWLQHIPLASNAFSITQVQEIADAKQAPIVTVGALLWLSQKCQKLSPFRQDYFPWGAE